MVADTVGGGAMTNETGTSNKEAFTPPAWRKMNDWVRHDPRHAPAVRLESRDPFATLAVVKEIAAPKPLVRSVPEPDITPQQAKITLNSTLVGGQRRVAVINGKTYRIGQLVAGETAKAKIQFTVADISQKVVVLERDGKKFDIKLHSFELTEPSDESALEGSK